MTVFDLFKEYGNLREAKRRDDAEKVLAEIVSRMGWTPQWTPPAEPDFNAPRCPICGKDWRYCGHPVEG
jgi:hypothetical protein